MERPRFEIAECPADEVDALQRELGVSGPLAQVLVRRGLRRAGAARAFLAADEEHSPTEPSPASSEAVETILRHVASGARITIHGDYDVDGICSTAVLVRSLRRLGANVDWYLPDRASDGYGLNPATVSGSRSAARGCWSRSIARSRPSRRLSGPRRSGWRWSSPTTTPRAPTGCCPTPRSCIRSLCGYPCPELCATAVAYKLAQALEQAAASQGLARADGVDPASSGAPALAEDLDLVALATIADVVPLAGENRALVRRGLRALAGTAKPGLRALMAVARVDPGKLNERSVAFALAPRLNAAGRLYRADAGLELVLTEDPLRAAQVAEELDRANHERRQVETRIRFEAEAQIAALGERAAYVLAGEDWHAGVIGIVASRLVERHRRPVVMIALDGDLGKGSGRSIEAFDLLGGLTACGGHLRRFGGHRAAAGLEIDRGRVEEFAQAFAAHAERSARTGRHGAAGASRRRRGGR